MMFPPRPLYPAALATIAFVATVSIAHPFAQRNAGAAQPERPLAQRIVHPRPVGGYPPSGGHVHAGANSMGFGALFNGGVFGPNFNFMHRGEIPPGAGIGHHFHNTADEMFVILNGEAQFTIDGRTALVKGPVGVVCRAGHSHAVYNASNETLQWINFQVSVNAGVSDAFDLGDDRVGATLDKVPTFMTARLDPELLTAAGRGGRGGRGGRPGGPGGPGAPGAPGAPAAGAPPAPPPPPAAPAAPEGVLSRNAADGSQFASTWAYLKQMRIQPGASTPAMAHDDIAEAYYVLAGSGTVTVGSETAPVGKWDAIPVRLADTSSFKNTGTEPLDLLIYGVAKDMDAKIASMKRR